MKHATILDAFNAAAGVTQQALGYADEWQRKKADAFLATIPDNFQTEFADYLRDTPFNYDGDPDDPDELKKYTDQYITDGQKRVKDYFDKKFGDKANIGYYACAKEAMQNKGLEAVRNHALIKQDKTHGELADIKFQKSADAYRDTMEPEDAHEAFGRLINWYKKERRLELTPQQEQKMRDGYAIQLYETSLSKALGGINDVNLLEKTAERVYERFSGKDENGNPTFMPKMTAIAYDEKGNVIKGEDGKPKLEERGWTFNGRDEWEQKQIELARERIYRESMDKALRADAVYRRLHAEGYRENNNGKIEQAERLADSWRKGVIAEIVGGNLKGAARNYAPGDHDRVAGLFMPLNERGGARLGGLSHAQIEKYMSAYADQLYLDYFNGRLDYESGTALREAMPELLWKEMSNFYGYEGDFEQFSREHFPFFTKMFDAMQKVAENPQTKAMIPVLRGKIKTVIEEDKDFQKYLGKHYEGQEKIIVQELLNDCTDMFLNTDWRNIEPEEALAQAQKIIGAFTGKQLAAIQKAGETDRYSVVGRSAEGTIAKREERLAEDLRAIYDTPQLVTTHEGQGARTWTGPDGDSEGYQKGLDAIYTQAKEVTAYSIAEGLGKDADTIMGKLRQVNKVDVKRDEEDPAAIFQYDNSSVFYRVLPDPKDKKKIIIEKQDTSNKKASELAEDKWERVVKPDRTEKSELGAARSAERERVAGQSRVESVREQMKNNPNDKALQKWLEREERDREELKDDILRERDDRRREDMIEIAVADGVFTEKEAQEFFGFNGRRGGRR